MKLKNEDKTKFRDIMLAIENRAKALLNDVIYEDHVNDISIDELFNRFEDLSDLVKSYSKPKKIYRIRGFAGEDLDRLDSITEEP